MCCNDSLGNKISLTIYKHKHINTSSLTFLLGSQQSGDESRLAILLAHVQDERLEVGAAEGPLGALLVAGQLPLALAQLLLRHDLWEREKGGEEIRSNKTCVQQNRQSMLH